MKNKKLKLIVLLSMIVFVILGVTAGFCEAGEYPTSPITLVVPFAPGGGCDAFAQRLRISAQKFLDVPLKVINISGAGGVVGAQFLKNAETDGYVVGIGSDGGLIVTPLHEEVGYDRDDFYVLAIMSMSSYTYCVPPDSDLTFVDIVKIAKEKPGTLRWGTIGATGIEPLGLEVLMGKIGGEVIKVPFSGASDVSLALRGGHLDVGSISDAAACVAYEAGSVKIVALATGERSDVFPEIPTVSEVTGTDFEWGTARSVVVSKDVPDEVKRYLEDLLYKIGGDPEFIKRTHDAGERMVVLIGKDANAHFDKRIDELKPAISKLFKK